VSVFDFTRAFTQAEDFLRRHIKPKAVQEAEKRRTGRKLREIGRRLKRGVAVSGASGAGIIGYGAMVAPLGTTALIAAAAGTAIAAGTALLWPKRAEKISREELIALAADAEEWLLEQRMKLPGRAIPALDAVFYRLDDLTPRVAALDPHSTLAWDLRRLLGDHLPRLVHSYVELPATVRDSDPTLLRRLTDGLATVDEELSRICREAARDHLTTFEAQERFLEVRYKDSDRLKGE
jgi:hypothetical protein